jgi:hypothetical protein
MRQRTVIALVATMLPAIAAAQDPGKYQCSYGEMVRRVEVAHEPGVEVPCSVHYYKDTEMPGEQQVLWSADSDATYCVQKAKELVAKLEGWGWDCGRDSETAIEEDIVDEERLGDPDGPHAPDLIE